MLSFFCYCVPFILLLLRLSTQENIPMSFCFSSWSPFYFSSFFVLIVISRCFLRVLLSTSNFLLVHFFLLVLFSCSVKGVCQCFRVVFCLLLLRISSFVFGLAGCRRSQPKRGRAAQGFGADRPLPSPDGPAPVNRAHAPRRD